MHIRPAEFKDSAAIWGIIGPTIRAGETYTLDRDMSEAAAVGYWLGADRETFVAEQDGEIVGTYYIRANQQGGGRHICNCGYMVSAKATGRGIARAMSIAVLCETQEQVDEYWRKIVAAGGKPVACGWITDHFGVSWQIDPKMLIDMITDPDPVKAGKAMVAMMQMVKIESSKLQIES
ncbi:MAG: GNAT family N-acetyltransferase [Planctomycetes bacterium]|nr:GNAT family N-acetyltransferase [Planctomycetota bacterium]